MKKVLPYILLIFFIGLAVIWRHSRLPSPAAPPKQPTPILNRNEGTTIQSTVPYKMEIVAQNLSVPWSIVFTSSSRILVTERPGKIREIVNGKLNETPLMTFSEVNSVGEEGLMGLEKDPDYAKNNYLYAAVSYPKNKGYVDKVVRLIDKGTSIVVDTILLDNIPAAQVHAGSRLKFGPDRKLYVTTGDATQKEKAQDKNFLGGKILRMNADGSIPSDNPFPDSYVYTFGHRNPQGITWNIETKEMFETEHGPSGFDGPGGGDEVNHITAGANYGWPVVSHEKTKEGMISPLSVYTPAVAPASALLYSGNVFPQFKNNLFFGGLRGTGLYRVVLDPRNPNTVLSQEKLPDISVGRIRDCIEGPEGYIYFSTSNKDGRGQPNPGDDKIYRLVPRK